MNGSTVTSKGQITLPVELRAEYGIEKGHKIYFLKGLDGQLEVKILKPEKGAGYGALKAYAGAMKGLPLDDTIKQAIDTAMSEKLERSRGKI